MAETYIDGENRGSIRAKLNDHANQINTTRRDWYSGFESNRCYHNNKKWNLSPTGNAGDTPGFTDSWVEETIISIDHNTQWTSGNTLGTVEEVISGQKYTLIVRPGGDRTVDPTSALGSAHWQISSGLILFFNESTASYYGVGQLVYYSGRLYEMLEPYSIIPDGSTPQWKDIIADAIADSPQAGGGASTSDGTLTTATFSAYDVAGYSYQETGSSGQSFTKSTAINGYTGLGYASAGTPGSTQSTGAKAFLSVVANSTQDRKAWVRARSTTVGAVIGGCSHGTGTYGLAAIPTANTWVWAEFAELHLRLDSQYQFFGITADTYIDRLILVESTSTDIPTGAAGFRSE